MDDYPDEEWVEDDDSGDDSGDDLLVCPSCRAAVHEDTQQCPQCGDWITPVYPATRWKRLVWTVVAVLAIALILMLTLR